ncbi:Polysialic acid O-acetyltransferase [Dissostichus eleginoides]|uniref:Polysialic acid O-acetyltransferase n=1 Tax=Dissostichus eleginoides TaxID=100907 RepID=A0AAD9B214_DISEL|nr:Polysialic acid O-acetyltransferase [Dissostichus eleginoides]
MQRSSCLQPPLQRDIQRGEAQLHAADRAPQPAERDETCRVVSVLLLLGLFFTCRNLLRNEGKGNEPLPHDSRLLPHDSRLLPHDSRPLPMNRLPYDSRLLPTTADSSPMNRLLPHDSRLLPHDSRLLPHDLVIRD